MKDRAAFSRISEAFEDPLYLPLRPDSRYILFSDCHRGSGNTNDNFLKNEPLYLAALEWYFHRDFTYLELGDGDELWENRSFSAIREAHGECFRLLARYYRAGRLHMLYGNHDIRKKHKRFASRHCSSCPAAHSLQEQPLFPGIRFYSGIILYDMTQRKDIYLTHGHQAELLNSTLWPLAQFLVRYLWKPLESIGVTNPTSAAANSTRKNATEKTLSRWAAQNSCILITGHTHRPVLGSLTASLSESSSYFNTGSCVRPDGITGIEISQGTVSLVKWSLKADEELRLCARREVLGEEKYGRRN